MKKAELEKKLKKNGFQVSSGSKHDLWTKEGYPTLAVPRHKGDIPTGTLNNLLKQAGLK